MSAESLRDRIAEAIASGRAGAARVNEKHRLVADRVLAVLGEEAVASPISMHSDAHNGLTEAEIRVIAKHVPGANRAEEPYGWDKNTKALCAIVARIRDEAVQAERERIAREIAQRYLGPDSGRHYDGREAADAHLRSAYDEGLQAAAEIARGES